MCACSDLMSQDDIDALINTMAAAGDARSQSEDFLKRIQPIVEKSLDSLGAIMSAFIGLKCELLSFEVIPANRGELAAILTSDDIGFKTDTTIKSQHSIFLTIDSQSAKKCANLMMGRTIDDELGEALGDIRASAISEIFSKILGGMTDIFKGSLYSEEDGSLTESVGIFEDLAMRIESSIDEQYYLSTGTFRVNDNENWNIQLVFDRLFANEAIEVAKPATEQRQEVQMPSFDSPVVAAGRDSIPPPEQPRYEGYPGTTPAPPPQQQQYNQPPPEYYYQQQPPPYGAVPQQEPQITYQPAQFQELPKKRPSYEARNIDVLLDVPLHITVVLGRSKVPIKSVLEYGQGSLITLDKLAGEPVDLVVNGKYFAKGEVVVIDENFGVRISSILSPEERLAQLTAIQPD